MVPVCQNVNKCIAPLRYCLHQPKPRINCSFKTWGMIIHRIEDMDGKQKIITGVDNWFHVSLFHINKSLNVSSAKLLYSNLTNPLLEGAHIQSPVVSFHNVE